MILEHPILTLASLAIAVLFLALTLLLLATMAKAHLVVAPRTYLVASAIGILSCFAFATIASRSLPTYFVVGVQPGPGLLVWILMPSALMAEAGLVGLLGANGLWRILFAMPIALGGIIFARLFLHLFPYLTGGPRPGP